MWNEAAQQLRVISTHKSAVQHMWREGIQHFPVAAVHGVHQTSCAHQFQLGCQMSDIYGHMAVHTVASKLLGLPQNPE